MSAIVSLIELSNRQSKRKFEHEAMSYAPQLQVIIENFISSIWSYPSHISYQDIYDYYHKLWNKTIDSFVRSQKTVISIDRHFFSNNYCPII